MYYVDFLVVFLFISEFMWVVFYYKLVQLFYIESNYFLFIFINNVFVEDIFNRGYICSGLNLNLCKFE